MWPQSARRMAGGRVPARCHRALYQGISQLEAPFVASLSNREQALRQAQGERPWSHFQSSGGFARQLEDIVETMARIVGGTAGISLWPAGFLVGFVIGFSSGLLRHSVRVLRPQC